jgi:uncharacterized protein YjbI with pentapeptide repeats
VVAASSLNAVMVMSNSGGKKRITVKASVKGVERAEKALVRKGVVSKEEFAKSILMGKSTVDKFFTRKAIQLDSFQRICEGLMITDWRNIAELEDVLEQLPTGNIEEDRIFEGAKVPDMIGVTSEKSATRVIIWTDPQSGVESEIILEGNIESVDNNFKTTIEVLFNSKLGIKIHVKDINPGSIKITVRGSKKDIAKLLDYINSGAISELEGFPIENSQILSPDFLEELGNKSDREKWDLVQDIITNRISDRKLNGVELSGAELSGAELSGAELIRANLRETRLSEANLSGANLTGANLRETRLSEANLSGANLTGASLSEAVLIRAELSEAILSKAELNEAVLIGARLIGANLTGANLYRANLTGARLVRANLTGARLIRANLSEANLSEANLTGVNLSEANLYRADLSKANLTGAIVENCNFGEGLGLSASEKSELKRKGAIFNDAPGDRSRTLSPR